MDRSTERLRVMRTSSLIPSKLETPGCEPDVSNYTCYEFNLTPLSPNPPAAQQLCAAPTHQRQLRIHRDACRPLDSAYHRPAAIF